jgi:L-amino acid N-acyltransferase YncA
MIREGAVEDAAEIAAIYNYYIQNTVASFEEEDVTAEDMAQRMRTIIDTHPWLVYEEGGEVIGYVYARPWKARSAYKHSVECSMYLDQTQVRKGIGTKLYLAMVARLKEMKVHCIIGGVALPNPASCGLLEKFGFEKVAHFKEVGMKLGQWVDVAYWQQIIQE